MCPVRLLAAYPSCLSWDAINSEEHLGDMAIRGHPTQCRIKEEKRGLGTNLLLWSSDFCSKLEGGKPDFFLSQRRFCATVIQTGKQGLIRGNAEERQQGLSQEQKLPFLFKNISLPTGRSYTRTNIYVYGRNVYSVSCAYSFPRNSPFWGYINYFLLSEMHLQVNLTGNCLIFCAVTLLVFPRNKKVQVLPVVCMMSLETPVTEVGTEVVQTGKGWIFCRKPEEVASQVLPGGWWWNWWVAGAQGCESSGSSGWLD